MRHYLFAVALLGVTTTHAAELPFRLATSTESSSLTGASVIATPLDQTNFSTAATANVKKKTSGSIADTARADQAISKVYVQALDAGPSPGAQAVPPAVAPVEYLDYEENLNSAQAWATMSETGAPFVQIYADGKSQGQAAASWRTRYTVQGSGSRDVYVRFKIPELGFGGRWEDAAPSLTRGRLRVDFLVNAYPAWSTEAIRWNEENDVNGDTVRVDTFGSPIGFEGNSHGSNTHILSVTAKTITLKLGTYPSGKWFDFTLLFQVEGAGDSQCAPSGGEMDCGNITMKVNWDPNAPQPTFFSKPAT